MKKYKIVAEFSCVIVINNTELELEPNFIMEGEFEENSIIKVYPIEKKENCYSLAYSAKLCDLEFIDFKEFRLVELKQKLIAKNHIELLCHEYEKCIYKLYSYPHIFVCNNHGKVYKKEFDENFDEYEIKNNYLIAKTQDKMIFCVFHKESKKFSCIKANSIEIEKNKITAINILNNIAKHNTKTEYSFDDKELKEIHKDIYYTIEPKLTYQKDIMPLAFLQAIMVEDYNLARKYLTTKLKTKLTTNHLKAFFGKIEKIIPIENLFAVIEKNKNTTIYKFEFEENLINNIISL